MAALSTDEMRRRLAERYSGSLTWAARIEKMNDNQIYAIYMRIFARN